MKVLVYIPEDVFHTDTEYHSMSIYIRCHRALSKSGVEASKKRRILKELSGPWASIQKALEAHFNVTHV